MLDGMRQAFLRLSEQYDHLDGVASNQANSSTPGYRAGDSGVRQGQFSQWLRNEQGARVHTGRDLDVALPADAYLSVQTPAGVRYTRRGDLGLNDQRQLVTGAGDVVLDQAGAPIQVPNGLIKIYENGSIVSGTTTVAKLGRYRLAETQQINGSLFSPAGDQAPTPDEGQISVGDLESSNVNVTLEQSRLIAIQNRTRVYSQVIQAQDQTLEKAFQDLGRGH